MSRVVIEETIRRHVTNIWYVAFVALLAIIGLGTSRFAVPGAGWPSLVALLTIIAGCRPIGPEFSSGTLQLILVKPINRATYLLSRVAGVVLVVWLAMLVACTAEIVGRMVQGGVPWAALGRTLLHTAATTVLAAALLALFGTLSRAYVNAALYVTLTIALSMAPPLLQFMRVPDVVVRAIVHIDRNLFPDAPSMFDAKWLLMVLSNAAVALTVACFAFRNREVPYGAD